MIKYQKKYQTSLIFYNLKTGDVIKQYKQIINIFKIQEQKRL